MIAELGLTRKLTVSYTTGPASYMESGQSWPGEVKPPPHARCRASRGQGAQTVLEGRCPMWSG